jgi:hypothetical protein
MNQATDLPPRSLFLRWLLFLLVFSPALYAAFLMKQTAVDVGCWDMWENAPLLKKWHDGTLTWHDLYAPQIQHRIVVPRLMIIAMTHLSGGDFRWENYAALLIFAANAVMLWFLLGRTMGNSPWRWPLMFAFNLLLFCPMHFQILLWGSAMWAAIPMAGVLGCLLLLNPREQPSTAGVWLRFAGAVVLAEMATHSFAHGIGVWPVMLGIFLFQPTLGSLKQRLILSAVWIVIAGITIGCYFTNFINVAYHAYNLKPGDNAFETGGGSLLEGGRLKATLNFFFAFLGTWFARSPFVDHPLDTAVTLGKWTVAWIAVLVIFTLRARLLKAVLPWMALALYVVVIGLLVSKRASDIGEHRAVTPRYLAASQYLLVAGIAITATLGTVFRRAGERWREKHPDELPELKTGGQSFVSTLGVIAITAFCTAQIPVWQYGLHLTHQWHLARRQAQVLQLFMPHLNEQRGYISIETLDMVKKNWNVLDAINTLQGLNLLRTKPLSTPELSHFSREKKPLPLEKADVTEAHLLPDGTLQLKGVARFNVGQPVDAILLVQEGRVISLGQYAPKHLLRIYGLDYEFGNYQDVPVKEMYPWEVRVKLASLDAPIELWALESTEKFRKITPLKASIKLDPAAKTATIVHEEK